MTSEEITEMQRRLGREWAETINVVTESPSGVFTYRTEPHPRRWAAKRHNLRRSARWWELEALRGYPSSEDSRRYAANMRWLVELMDNGVRVVGRRFDEIVREQGARP